jgi:hypothetical protein
MREEPKTEIARIDPPEGTRVSRVTECRGGPEQVSAVNWSDPVVWAAKLAYERFITIFGAPGANMIATFQRVQADLNANPERGELARRAVRAKRFFRGIWRVLNTRLYMWEWSDVGQWRDRLARSWRSRRVVEANGVLRDWDTDRDELLRERAGIVATLEAQGFDVEEVILHKQRLDMAIGTAPKKPEVNYGIRDQGFVAARDKGLRLTDNPYPDGSVEHRSWAKGWKQGVPAGGNRRAIPLH